MSDTFSIPPGIIPLRLRDLYARIDALPINNYTGFSIIGSASEAAALAALEEEKCNSSRQIDKTTLCQRRGASSFFIIANSILSYLSHNDNQGKCGAIVTIILPGLRNLYWDNRHLLSPDELPLLTISMSRPIPTFVGVHTYRKLASMIGPDDTAPYQLIGSITPYDVVHIPLASLIDRINCKQPIRVRLSSLDVIIEITYKDYDFWDSKDQRLIDTIGLGT